MGEYAYKLIKHAVIGFCFLMAVYMTVKQIIHFSQNNDLTVISYKQFNDRPKDVYPTFTICFRDFSDWGTLYNLTYVNETAAITPIEYLSILKGIEDDQKISNIKEVDFQLAMVGRHEVFKELTVSAHKQSEKEKQSFTNKNQPWPFYISHQDPQRICFTRTTQFEEGVVRESEKLWLQPLSTLTSRITNYTDLYIYMHHPGCLLYTSPSPRDATLSRMPSSA